MRIAPVVGAAIGAAFLLGPAVVEPAPRLVWNVSASAPKGPYAVRSDRRLVVGDWVAIAPPDTLAAWLADRGYLGRGAPLLKRVAALPPDVICRTGAEVRINEELAAHAQWRDRLGRPLPVWRGCRRLAGDELFVLNPAPDSLDGRYFGPLSRRQVIGRALPLNLESRRSRVL